MCSIWSKWTVFAIYWYKIPRLCFYMTVIHLKVNHILMLSSLCSVSAGWLFGVPVSEVPPGPQVIIAVPSATLSLFCSFVFYLSTLCHFFFFFVIEWWCAVKVSHIIDLSPRQMEKHYHLLAFILFLFPYHPCLTCKWQVN